MPLWNALDSNAGFTQHWDVSVSRVRDQLALSTLTLLSATVERAEEHESPSYGSHSPGDSSDVA